MDRDLSLALIGVLESIRDQLIEIVTNTTPADDGGGGSGGDGGGGGDEA